MKMTRLSYLALEGALFIKSSKKITLLHYFPLRHDRKTSDMIFVDVAKLKENIRHGIC